VTSAISLNARPSPDDPGRLLAAILECSHDALVAETLDGEITIWSPGAERVYGYRAEEARGRSIEFVVPPDRWKERAELGRRVRLGERVGPLETVRLRKDGTAIDVVVIAAPIEDARGAIVGVSTITSDVTQQRKLERERAEAELGLSWDNHRLLFESNPNPMWVYDCETLRFLAVNDAAVRSYGYPRPEFLAMTVSDIRPPGELPRLHALLKDERRGAARGPSPAGTWRHLRSDGTIIEVEVTSHALSFDGRRARVVLAHDVTGKAEAERALRESEARYRSLIENAHDLIATVDLDGRFTSVNRAFERALGYSRAELLGRTLLEFVPAEQCQSLQGAQDLKLAGAVESTTYEHELIAKDGSRLTVEVASRLIAEDGRPVGVEAICRDVTERRRAAEALRESQELYRLVVESSSDMIALYDPEGTFVYVSPSYEATLGYQPSELVGRRFGEFLHPDEREAMLDGFAAVVAGETRSGVARVLGADGEYVTIDGTASRILGPDGGVRMVMSSYRDIGEQMRAERLEERLNQAQRLEAVGRLAGGIAHDFNNLLTAITGFGEIALARLGSRDDDPRLRECIEEIRGAADKATTLTAQLLAFSRQQLLQPHVLDLNSVVEEYAPMLERLLGDDIELRLALGAGLGAVLADEGQLGQVIVNLAVNARDAMAQGGDLTFTTQNVDLDEQSAPVGLAAGPHVLLAVTDSGAGIQPELLGQIFEPFFTTKERGQGTGLGLATVLGIVQQSGGQVTVYSEPGEGSTFKVYLPRTDAPLPNAVEPVAGPARSGDERILLVEDNDAVRRLACDVLAERGYTVLEAASPRDALDLFRTLDEPVDLLVTDVVMPGMNGRQLADELRQHRPDLRVLYTSGYTDDTVIARGVLEQGMAFLQKPFGAEQLERKTRDVLDAPRPCSSADCP
jgi:two-component system cell cycle sensor histidine kinase/response regulator CckA